MELVERYLHAVAGYLPKAQADDIIAELRVDLLAQVEERESALGRPLTPAEAEALLREHGHPMLVAAGYLPQQHLIGPAVYPYWHVGMRYLLLGLLLFYAVISAIHVVNGHNLIRTAIQGALGWANLAITLGALLTLVMALLERGQVRLRLLDRWSPLALPPPDKLLEISRGEALFTAILHLLLLGWWWGFIDVPMPMGRNGYALGVSLSGAWQPYVLPIAGILGAVAVLNAANFILPNWTRPRLLFHVLINVVTVGIAIALLQAGSLVDVDPGAQVHDRIELWLNISTRIVLAIIAAGSAWEIFKDSRRLGRLTSAS